MHIKLFFPTAIAFLILTSCGTDKTRYNKSSSGTIHRDTVIAANSPSSGVNAREFKTRTGKIMMVSENKLSASVSVLSVSSVNFKVPQKAFESGDVDPLENVLTGDLNKDGFDELYLITCSAGSGSACRIYGFSSIRDSILIPINIPELGRDDFTENGGYIGYMGHDSIYIINQELVRSFPVYKKEDPNCCPTGGKRNLYFTLATANRMFILKLKRVESKL
jgi:hypothetical protein